MRKQSIAFRLSLYIILAVSAVISIVVYLNYDFSKKVLMQNIEESAINQFGLITNHVARNVVSTQEISRNVINQAPYYLAHDDLDLFLMEVVKANEILFGMHIDIFETDKQDKQHISVSRKSTDEVIFMDSMKYCQNHHFPKANNVDEVQMKGQWSKPYYCNMSDSTLLISYFQPIIGADGNQIGKLSSEISLDFLDEIVSRIKVKETGFTFVISQEGEYITHPQKDWIMKRNIFDISSKILPEKATFYQQSIVKNGSVSGFAYPELLNFEKAWFYAKSIPFTKWMVIIVVPARELFRDLELLYRKIVIVSATGLLMIFIIVVFLFRQLLTPLMQRIRSVQRFSFGDKGRKSKKDELELLNESLEELQQQYSHYLKEQTQSRKDRRKYERDIKSAKEIQTTIIPASSPDFPKSKRVDLYAELHPAESIGGDLYDYFFIDSNHLLFSMGDVSGKGIPAALFMAVAHTLIKSKATILSASHIVETVNKELSRQNSNQHFLTLFLGILDIETGVLSYCNAAHNYPYIIRNGKKVEVLDKTHGLPIGLYPNKTYSDDSSILQPGDTIVLFTDGVIDCKDSEDHFYGTHRLSENISNLAELFPKELVKRIDKSLRIFKGETKQSDDISLMAVRYLE